MDVDYFYFNIPQEEHRIFNASRHLPPNSGTIAESMMLDSVLRYVPLNDIHIYQITSISLL
jgi:hypothetical protein